MFKKIFYIVIMGLLFNLGLIQAESADEGRRYSDIVIEADNGHVLHSTDANSIRHPASLTKMMTIYLTFQALQDGRLELDQQLPISIKAAHQPPTNLGLKAGQTISVRDAILSVIIQSANDSALVLGEAIGGSEANFGQLMTKQAAELGMTQTQFYNASGLPNPNQVTSAYDMAELAAALVSHFPQFYNFFGLDRFSYDGNVYHNHNHLMDRYPGMDGIKTGYIESSGFNLVASAKRGGVRLIGVVFGGSSPQSRDQQMAKLLNESFGKIEQQKTQLSNLE